MRVHEKLSVYIEGVSFQVPAVRTYQLLLVCTCVCAFAGNPVSILRNY